jgi:putative SOS response-associated peptidase YedK
MCGRFVMKVDKKDLEDIIREVGKNAASDQDLMTLKLEGEVFPTDIVPVKTASGMKAMRWGYKLPKTTIINARFETVMEKPMFREAMTKRRCVVPASGYFEWKQELDGKKTKYRFRSPDDQQLYMAGCYRIEQGSSVPAFVILTQDADSRLAQFHDRMPVILSSKRASLWLDPSRTDIGVIVHSSVTGLEFSQA